MIIAALLNNKYSIASKFDSKKERKEKFRYNFRGKNCLGRKNSSFFIEHGTRENRDRTEEKREFNPGWSAARGGMTAS